MQLSMLVQLAEGTELRERRGKNQTSKPGAGVLFTGAHMRRLGAQTATQDILRLEHETKAGAEIPCGDI